MNLKMERRLTDGVTAVACQGRIVFGDEAAELRESLKTLLGSTRRIVLNLSAIGHIDSGGLGMLVGVFFCSRLGGDIKLTGLGPV